jgi:hypothetical protein
MSRPSVRHVLGQNWASSTGHRNGSMSRREYVDSIEGDVMRPHLSVEQRQLARRLSAKGLSLREIGRQVG